MNDFSYSGEYLVVVSSYAEGPTLADVLRSRGPLAADAAARVIASIADGLDYLASRGFVHGALKPSKIILDSNDTPAPCVLQVRDAALRPLRGASAELQFIGATHVASVPPGVSQYSAPELIEGRAATPHSDVFSLGLVASDMLSGVCAGSPQSLFEMLAAAMQDRRPDVRARLASFAPELADAVARAVAPRPDERSRTCGEFAAAFARAIKGETHERGCAGPATTAERPPHPRPEPPAPRNEPPGSAASPGLGALVRRLLGKRR
jgi:serine/threonine-protein kinase